MSYSIAIIGAGWYGCHLASSLGSIGMDVKVFEKNARPLHEASGNNQFRLHLGFHYARHYNTRMQSRDGYMRFRERYPSLSGLVANNIYAVPTQNSLIDFLTYRLIMTASGIDFSEPSNINIKLNNIEGLLLTEEQVLYIESARRYFKQRLGDRLILNQKVDFIEEKPNHIYVNGECFDYVIDATWGHFKKPPMQVFYEPTILLYYELKETKESFPALTFVDGPLCSIYPTEDAALYTLSSVPHTPIKQCHSAAEARDVKNKIDRDFVLSKVKSMESQISHYVPDFQERFTFVGPQLSIKTKPVGSSDDRSCYVLKQGRIFSVMSGKIDTVFFATERILSMLDSSTDSEIDRVPSFLREDIDLYHNSNLKVTYA
jgi:hypothetical protein